MANIQERRNKEGKLIAFSIRVHRGRSSDGKQLKPYTTTFSVEPTWKEESARKKALAFAAVFEKECKSGCATDSKAKFESYCEYVISLKETRGVKRTTIDGYRNLTKRIYPAIGYLKISEITASTLNKFYTSLSANGLNKKTGGKLSNKTILEYHRLISTVLEQAVKEGIVPFNAAARAELPKIEQKEVNYFQPEEVHKIREALENEPIKWKTVVHMFLITGARRGEILGLKWKNVDFENNRIYICNNVLYSPKFGVYEDTPKTKKSIRYVSLPTETMELLKTYKSWQDHERFRLNGYYQNLDFVFCKEDGTPMHPDSITNYMTKFSKKYSLPHLNPHAFRHTMASILYFNGVDNVSISERLGHAQVSTTANIYAHVIEQADKKNADILSDILLKA